MKIGQWCGMGNKYFISKCRISACLLMLAREFAARICEKSYTGSDVVLALNAFSDFFCTVSIFIVGYIEDLT